MTGSAAPSPARSIDDPLLAELRARPSLLGEIDVRNGCPVTPPQHVQGATLAALGSEPLYAGGLSGTTAWDEAIEIEGGRYLEIHWLSEPTYLGVLFVRGVNLSTGEAIEFRSADGTLSDELYLTTGTSSEAESVGPGFRTWRTHLNAPGRGCYGVQVEGIGHFGGYSIVFEVT